MTKFRLLGAALSIAVAAFTVSCDKDSLPEGEGNGLGPILGDGETSAIIVDALLNDELTDLTVTLGEEVIGSSINYKDVTDAFGIETGDLLLNVTAFDEEQGKTVEIYNEYVTINDETFYLILITLGEDGFSYDVKLLDYDAEDFDFNDELALELDMDNDEGTDLYSLNVINYNVAYQDDEFTVELGILSEGLLEQEEIAVLGYGSNSETLLNNDGILSTLDLIVYGEEFTEIIGGDRRGEILLSSVLDNLDLDTDLDIVDSGDNLELILFGDDNEFDFIIINLNDLEIDLNNLNIQL